jgi:hypothetical protein
MINKFLRVISIHRLDQLSGGGNSDIYKIENKTVKYVGRNEDQQLSIYQDTTGDIIPGFINDEESLEDYFSLEQMFTA